MSDDKKFVIYELPANDQAVNRVYRITYKIGIGNRVPTGTQVTVDTWVMGVRTTLTLRVVNKRNPGRA